MQIAIVGNPHISILYDEELRNRLAKCERERTPSIDYFLLLSTLGVDMLRAVIRRVSRPTNTRLPPPDKG